MVVKMTDVGRVVGAHDGFGDGELLGEGVGAQDGGVLGLFVGI